MIYHFYLKEIKLENVVSALKQALSHGLIFKKVHKVIQFNQEEWLQPYINENTKLRTEAKKWFWKRFF